MLSTINKLASILPHDGSLVVSKPLRTVLRWQAYVTVVMALMGAAWAGIHAATSVLLGGLVVIAAEFVFALMTSSRRIRSPGETIRVLIRAEAVKIALIVLQLWFVLTMYREVVAPLFIAAFIVALLIYPTALLVRE